MSALAFMGVGGGEAVIVVLVLLLLFGAKNIPDIARTIGKYMEQFRRAARDVQDEILHAKTEIASELKAAAEMPSAVPPAPAAEAPGPDAWEGAEASEAGENAGFAEDAASTEEAGGSWGEGLVDAPASDAMPPPGPPAELSPDTSSPHPTAPEPPDAPAGAQEDHDADRPAGT